MTRRQTAGAGCRSRLTATHLRQAKATRLQRRMPPAYAGGSDLSLRRSILPRSFFGKEGTNSIQGGYLYGPRGDFTKSFSSSIRLLIDSLCLLSFSALWTLDFGLWTSSRSTTKALGFTSPSPE